MNIEEYKSWVYTASKSVHKRPEKLVDLLRNLRDLNDQDNEREAAKNAVCFLVLI